MNTTTNSASSGEKLLARFQAQTSGVKPILFFLSCFTVLIITLNLYFTLFSRSSTVELREFSPTTSWQKEYILRSEELHASLDKRGSVFERLVFTSTLNALSSSVQAYVGNSVSDVQSFSGRIWVGLHYAVMNVLYIFLWWFRFWFLYMVGSCAWAYHNFKSYEGEDFLGQMGNGRMYFSGLRARLGKVSRRGVPEFQVRGVACLAEAPEKEVEETALVAALDKFGARNDTTFTLARYLLADPTFPAFVGERGVSEEAVAQKDVPSLAEHATQVVKVALEVHRALKTGNHYCLELEDEERFLRRGFKRVLTRKLAKAISALSSAEVATAILAFEAGKLMTFDKDAGYWMRVSQFPQLNSRAILHSVASYPKDFQADQRDLIRQAIIYSEREGIYAPVQLPVGLSEEVLALRQWIEFLWSLPFDIEEGADTVEAFGIIYEINRSWELHAVKSLVQGETFFVSGAYSSHDDTLFIPFMNVMALLLRITEKDTIDRLAILIDKRQKRVAADKGRIPDGASPCSLNDLRILPKASLDTLMEVHSIPENEAKQWSVLRNVLQYFSWIAFRVGDRSIPESSVVNCIVRHVDAFDVSNQPQFLNAEHLIPIRGSRIKESAGASWGETVPHVTSIVMVGPSVESSSHEEIDSESHVSVAV